MLGFFPINHSRITDNPVTSWSRAAAGALLVTALFYAPWDDGGTSAAAISHLDWGLAAIFCCWLLGTVGRGRSGRFWSWSLFGFSLLLLLLGWGMALNAHAVYDADYLAFLPLSSPWPRVPGAADFYLSAAMMVRVTVLLGCVWAVAGLVQDERWLLRIWWAIGLAGGSIALLGLVQKATGAALPFWESLEPGEPPVSTFFASFYYHGNAGAFLNLALPAVLGLAFRYVTRRSNPVARALWLALSVIMVIAVISDTSRMGQFIAALMMMTLLMLATAKVSRRRHLLEWKTVAIALLVGGVALWAVVQTSHLDRSLGRWDRFQSTWTKDARWQVDGVAIQALPQAGALGFGPGTFSAVFPFLLDGASEDAQGSWLFLHNDYLQTLLEWGWVGGVLWAGVFFGGMLVAVRGLADKERAARWFPRQRLSVLLALSALTGVALHAAVDFPLQIFSIQLYAATWLGLCWGSGGFGRLRRSS